MYHVLLIWFAKKKWSCVKLTPEMYIIALYIILAKPKNPDPKFAKFFFLLLQDLIKLMGNVFLFLNIKIWLDCAKP